MASVCLECDNPAKHKCQKCHVAEYCSATCQKSHWNDGEHHLVCFSIHQPDMDQVNDLIQMVFVDEDAQVLQQLAKENQNDPEVMYGIASLIQSAYEDDEEDVGYSYRREKAKHNLKRWIPGTDAFKARRREKRRRRRRFGRRKSRYSSRPTPEELEADRRRRDYRGSADRLERDGYYP